MWRKISLFFVLSLLPLWAVALPDALLERFGIPTDATPKELVQITQERWCQKGKERWEFTPQFEEMHAELEPVFRDMGYLDEVIPQHGSYDYALVHGATLHTLQARVRSLESLFEQGVEVKQIVFFSGMRKLLDAEKISSGLEWESDLARWVYENSQLPQTIPVSFVNAPEKLVDGKYVRPTTKDTVMQWLKNNPKPGTCLAISNQPYVLYQDAVVRRLLPKEFELETVGPETRQWQVAIVLDAIAKTLYEEQK